jgi:hypothetical protein
MTVYLVIFLPEIPYVHRIYIGLARTIYVRFIYGIFGRDIIKYTVIYGAYIILHYIYGFGQRYT